MQHNVKSKLSLDDDLPVASRFENGRDDQFENADSHYGKKEDESPSGLKVLLETVWFNFHAVDYLNRIFKQIFAQSFSHAVAQRSRQGPKRGSVRAPPRESSALGVVLSYSRSPSSSASVGV